MSDENTNNESANPKVRDNVTMIVLTGGFVTLLVAAILYILSDWYFHGQCDAAKTVFNAILPVTGTWIGTLLAYYFGKANFEAAQKSVTDMAKGISGLDKLKSIPVREKMIPRSSIKILPDLLEGKRDDERLLKDIVAFMEKEKIGRLPLFKSDGAFRAIIHRSAFNDFISRKAFGSDSAAVATLRLADLFSDQKYARLVQQCVAFVSENATLADAKNAMDHVSVATADLGNCEDAFVTKTGESKEPVLGWVTNDIIVENARV